MFTRSYLFFPRQVRADSAGLPGRLFILTLFSPATWHIPRIITCPAGFTSSSWCLTFTRILLLFYSAFFFFNTGLSTVDWTVFLLQSDRWLCPLISMLSKSTVAHAQNFRAFNFDVRCVFHHRYTNTAYPYNLKLYYYQILRRVSTINNQT